MAGKGLGILLALGAGVGLLALSSDAKAEGSGGTGSGTGLGGGPAIPIDDSCFDANMPPDLKAKTLQLLQDNKLTKADFEAAATAAEAAGYPKSAACLRQKGKNTQATKEQEVAASGGMQHQIRFGDIPYNMAQYYTGDGSRFRELEPLNPQIGSLQTVEWPKGSGKKVSNYPGWIPGKIILIPASWHPLDKPLPAPLGVSSASANPPGGTIVPNSESGTLPSSVQDVFAKWGVPSGQPGGTTPTSPSSTPSAIDAIHAAMQAVRTGDGSGSSVPGMGPGTQVAKGSGGPVPGGLNQSQQGFVSSLSSLFSGDR